MNRLARLALVLQLGLLVPAVAALGQTPTSVASRRLIEVDADVGRRFDDDPAAS